MAFFLCVESFEKVRSVVEYEIVFEDTDDMTLIIVNDIVNQLK